MLIRQEIGDVLRDFRQRQNQTLRQVASRANVALGYLSEIERGQKEASSEILASLADALNTPVSVILREVADRMALVEGITVPDVIPDSVTASVNGDYDAFDRFLVGTVGEAIDAKTRQTSVR
jgi:transcriptional regulator with XRE-family HTH domain